ncbi:uncharacterized protein EV420DRAFT_134655 [Desarmillaria tabescens]|uniref:Uncharacterized protein n=1 Tax=Armillaria tabescens TaxID=1929756 RepID=A0AA39TWV9_ARMTA|nr:uncharacterized protein EV420DRAFT_134655 [Desarmillaria tabescens]KAK0461880.1 hypothetical protein EV420DRAFT_134655 [Desarmillaria tabescens]
MDPTPLSPGARIRSCLQQLEDALKDLMEIDPAATPGTVKKRDDLIKEILERMSQMTAMNILSRRHPTPTPQPGSPATPQAATVDPVIARFQSLLPKFDAKTFPPLTAQNLKYRLTTPNNGNYATAEDVAFETLFRGYSDTTHNWTIVLSSMIETRNKWGEVCKKTQGIRTLDTEVERIVAIDKFLDAQISVGCSEMYINFVIRGIETIRYVKIWDAEPNDDRPGERKWKIDYLKDTFRSENPVVVRTLNEALEAGDEPEINRAKKAYKTRLDAHRKKHQRKMEMRRPLAILYDYFGAAVFLEPTWDVVDKSQKRPRSKMFTSLLTHLCTHLPEENGIPIPARRYEANENALREILTVFAPETLNYVQDFLNEFSPVRHARRTRTLGAMNSVNSS